MLLTPGVAPYLHVVSTMKCEPLRRALKYSSCASYYMIPVLYPFTDALRDSNEQNNHISLRTEPKLLVAAVRCSLMAGDWAPYDAYAMAT